MANFFDKLKKGMGENGAMQDSDIKEESEAPEEITKTDKEPETAKIIFQKPKRKSYAKKPPVKKFEEEKNSLDKEFPVMENKEAEEPPFLPQTPASMNEEDDNIEEDIRMVNERLRGAKKSREKTVFATTPLEDSENANEDKAVKIKKKDWLEQEGQLTVDVYETDKDIIIKSAIAGVRPEELDISVENGMVIVKGERKHYDEKREGKYYYQECYWGKFSREIVLPQEVNSSKTEAAMKDGVLTIKIPKVNKEKKNRINISEQ